jgi:mannose-6-phosphate isomerase
MSDVHTYGGNRVARLDLGRSGRKLLGSGPYEYFLYETKDAERFQIDSLRSFSVYLLSKPGAATVTVEGYAAALEQGDVVQGENCAVALSVQGGAVRFLVAGTAGGHPEKSGVQVTRHAEIYKVQKPWGHELWVNGQHPRYALKEIYIRAGTKTSLQYHNFKQETNVIFRGVAKLHYKSNAAKTNDAVMAGDTASVELEAVSSIDVMPGTLHRLEAMTDILLFETSTPHLDDVVRVSDDSQRPNGRVEQEHRH